MNASLFEVCMCPWTQSPMSNNIFVRPSLASCRFCACHSLHELRPSKFHAGPCHGEVFFGPATTCNPTMINMDVSHTSSDLSGCEAVRTLAPFVSTGDRVLIHRGMQDANRLTGPGTTPAFELSWMRCYDM